eukprot:scaffold22859_cov36-Phaeocystis_antarctica.AAC.1
MPKALSALVWKRIPTMTFFPATASDVLGEASIVLLLARAPFLLLRSTSDRHRSKRSDSRTLIDRETRGQDHGQKDTQRAAAQLGCCATHLRRYNCNVSIATGEGHTATRSGTACGE